MQVEEHESSRSSQVEAIAVFVLDAVRVVQAEEVAARSERRQRLRLVDERHDARVVLVVRVHHGGTAGRSSRRKGGGAREDEWSALGTSRGWPRAAATGVLRQTLGHSHEGDLALAVLGRMPEDGGELLQLVVGVRDGGAGQRRGALHLAELADALARVRVDRAQHEALERCAADVHLDRTGLRGEHVRLVVRAGRGDHVVRALVEDRVGPWSVGGSVGWEKLGD